MCSLQFRRDLQTARRASCVHAVTGSFECVRKINDANAVVIPCGHDPNGVQIVDPVVAPPPVIAPVPAVQANQPPVQGGAPPIAPVVGAVQDPNAALIPGMLAATQAMTQVSMQSDQRNASMTLQQSQLQAATMGANAQQLQHLTNHLGNLGAEVGRAIASHPTRIQATLSHPSAIPGQSNDPRQLGSLTRPIPVGMSVQGFNYGPYVQAFQPQPNDKNTRRIDEATHQIVQRHLPPSVKVRCDAAHTSGVVLPVGDFIQGVVCVVETRVNTVHQIVQRCHWYCTFSTGCITLSRFMLQPNIQERDFG